MKSLLSAFIVVAIFSARVALGASKPALDAVSATPKASGAATLSANVTANGSATTVVFSYGLDTKYGATKQATVAADAVNTSVSVDLSGLIGRQTYHFKVDATNLSETVSTTDQTFVALAYEPSLELLDATDIRSHTVTLHAKVSANGTSGLVYFQYGLRADFKNPPNSAIVALKTDDVSRQISASLTGLTNGRIYYYRFVFALPPDNNPLITKTTDSATVVVNPPFFGILGTHGGIIKTADGIESGYFQITVTPFGTFTGSVLINGHLFRLMGSFRPDGRYGSAITADGLRIPVELKASQSGTGGTITAKFAEGFWTAEAAALAGESKTRSKIAGRYNVLLPAGGSATANGGSTTTDTTTTTTSAAPEGTGWAMVRAWGDGTASVKGRLSDGEKFSTSGVVTVASDKSTLTFFDQSSERRLFGSFQLGDTVSGTMRVNRWSGDRLFPDGFDVQHTVTGAPYVAPEQGDNVVSSAGSSGGAGLTLSFSGGGLTQSITRQMRFVGDDIRVRDPGDEDVKLSIDRDSGRIRTRFTTALVGERRRKIKGTALLIQGTSSTSAAQAAGVFVGFTQTGKVTLSFGSSTSGGTTTGGTTPGGTTTGGTTTGTIPGVSSSTTTTQ